MEESSVVLQFVPCTECALPVSGPAANQPSATILPTLRITLAWGAKLMVPLQQDELRFPAEDIPESTAGKDQARFFQLKALLERAERSEDLVVPARGPDYRLDTYSECIRNYRMKSS